jgi:hypothetical protein
LTIISDEEIKYEYTCGRGRGVLTFFLFFEFTSYVRCIFLAWDDENDDRHFSVLLGSLRNSVPQNPWIGPLRVVGKKKRRPPRELLHIKIQMLEALGVNVEVFTSEVVWELE